MNENRGFRLNGNPGVCTSGKPEKLHEYPRGSKDEKPWKLHKWKTLELSRVEAACVKKSPEWNPGVYMKRKAWRMLKWKGAAAVSKK